MAFGLALGLASPAFAQSADPVAPVRALSDGLLTIMKSGKTLGFRGRMDRIAPVVDRTFDLPLLTRLTIGPAWTKTAPADQAALLASFRKMTIARYAGNFSDHDGQTFVIEPKAEARGPDRLVRTKLTPTKGTPVAFDYRLRQGSGGWRIIDVFFQSSISQLATQRSDFARIIASGGAKALIAHLDALAAKAER